MKNRKDLEMTAATKTIAASPVQGDTNGQPSVDASAPNRCAVRLTTSASVLTPDQLEQFRQHLVASGLPWFEGDPDRPGYVVQVHPCGKRVKGTVYDKVFIPDLIDG